MTTAEQPRSSLQAAHVVCPACGGHMKLSKSDRQFLVCSYCQSTLVRQSTTWSSVGRSGDAFRGLSVFSLLQEGRRGSVRFQLVGREQFADDLTWHTDWYVSLENGDWARLSESDGGYVWYTRASLRSTLPAFDAWRSEAEARLGGVAYRVTAVRQCKQGAAEGEVGRALLPGESFGLIELRSHEDGVLRLDYATSPAEAWVGERVEFTELQIGVAQTEFRSVEELRHLACPSCGGQVRVQSIGVLASTCSSCGSLVDLSDDSLGIRLSSLDGRTFDPLLPLGEVGQLDGIEWLVIGFEWREGEASGEPFTWSEYQLYNPEVGFAFIVADRSAWRFHRQVVGAPKMRSDGQVAFFQDRKYSIVKRFETVSLYVAGEFSRKVEAGRKTRHAEFRFHSAGGAKFLCGEFFEEEELWLAGDPLSLAALVQAFPVFRETSVGAFAPDCPSCGQSLKLVSPLTRTVGCGNCGALTSVRADTGEPEMLARQSGAYSGTPALRSWLQIRGHDWQVLACAILLDHEKGISFRINLFDRQGTYALLRRIGEGWHLLVPLKNAVVDMASEHAVLTSEGRSTKFDRRIENRWTLTYFEGESAERIGPGETFDTQLFVASSGDSLWREKTGEAKHTKWWMGRPLPPEVSEAVSPKAGFLFQLAYAAGKLFTGRLP